MRLARRVAPAALLALTTACGSTVQLSSTGPAAGAGPDGLGAPAAAAPGQQVTGEALSGGPSSATGGGAAVGPGAAGSAATGPVAGAPGRPAAAGAGPASSGASIPGVTATTITIGVLAADPQANTTLENAGFGAASLGDEPASWRSMADEVNARGGIAGRRVELVFHLVNLTDPPATQGQQACARFTEDSKVAAVLSGYYYSSAHSCLSRKGVPALLGTNYGVDTTLAKETGTVVAWATPLLDRLATALPGAFRAMGRLRAGTAAGIFVTDAPAFTRSAAVLEAALEHQGVTVVTQTVRDSDSGDYGAAASDASAAVLRFRSAGVTEVLFVSHNAFEPTLFMQAASSQGYEPTYLLSTQQYPGSLVGLAPASQLDGALAVGWAPAVDLSSGYDASPRAQACLQALKKRGRTYSGASQALVGLLACDGMDLLQRAVQGAGGLTSRDAVLRNATDPGSGFVSAVTIATSFPGGRRDGVAAYRPMAYATDCGCFRYTGGVSPM